MNSRVVTFYTGMFERQKHQQQMTEERHTRRDINTKWFYTPLLKIKTPNIPNVTQMQSIHHACLTYDSSVVPCTGISWLTSTVTCPDTVWPAKNTPWPLSSVSAKMFNLRLDILQRDMYSLCIRRLLVSVNDVNVSEPINMVGFPLWYKEGHSKS